MTPKHLVVSSAAILVLSLAVKGVFIAMFNLTDLISVIIFEIAVALITTIVTRGIGEITYFETIFLFSWWFIMILFFDFIILGPIFGYDIFRHVYLWISYGVMILAVFLLHKRKIVSSPHPEG